MALDKHGLEVSIKTLLLELQDGSDREAAIDQLAAGLANAVDTYVKTAAIYATPAHVAAATMVAGGTYPVASANNLNCEIQ